MFAFVCNRKCKWIKDETSDVDIIFFYICFADSVQVSDSELDEDYPDDDENEDDEL